MLVDFFFFFLPNRFVMVFGVPDGNFFREADESMMVLTITFIFVII